MEFSNMISNCSVRLWIATTLYFAEYKTIILSLARSAPTLVLHIILVLIFRERSVDLSRPEFGFGRVRSSIFPRC
jgi:hypothetical protein